MSRAALAIIAALALALAGVTLWGASQFYRATKAEQRADACHAASVAAQKAQEALRTQERATNQEKADVADQSYRAGLDQARALTRAHMDAHRVQPQDHRSAPESIGQAGPASLPASVPAEAVMVSADDVRTCGDLYAYAISARDWALSVAQQSPPAGSTAPPDR